MAMVKLKSAIFLIKYHLFSSTLINTNIFNTLLAVHVVMIFHWLYTLRHTNRFPATVYAPGVRRQRGRPRSNVLGSQVSLFCSIQVNAAPPTRVLVLECPIFRMYIPGWIVGGWDLQLLMLSGTHRPCTPLAAVQTSCFRLVFGVQQAPLGTGRLSF